jgi:esterase/lipase superfamily enzyme
MMHARTVVLLIVAIFLGLVAAYLSKNLLSLPEPHGQLRAEDLERCDTEADRAAYQQPGEFHRVTVFYVTDRKVIDWKDRSFVAVWNDFAWSAVEITLIAVTVLGLIVLVTIAFLRKRFWIWVLIYTVIMLVALFTAPWVAELARVRAEQKRTGTSYGGKPGQPEYGTCEVTVPKNTAIGEMKEQSFLGSLFFQEDPKKTVILKNVEPKTPEMFFADVVKDVNTRAIQKEAFVLVHGYNNDFEFAVRRAAQLSRDLKFAFTPIVFSWPSEAKSLRYQADEKNVDFAIPDLVDFLCELAKRLETNRIHLIAHSMGNRILAEVLRRISAERKLPGHKYREVVLAAPDVDQEVFRKDRATEIAKISDRVTLYFTEADWALWLSQVIHDGARLGNAAEGLLGLASLDNVEVTAVEHSGVRHGYIYSNRIVIGDLYALLRQSLKPVDRFGVHLKEQGKLHWWELRP